MVLFYGSATGSYSWAAVRMGVVQGIDYRERNLRRFMRPTRRHIALDMRFGSNRVECQPLGVVGIILRVTPREPVADAGRHRDRRGKPRHAQTVEADTVVKVASENLVPVTLELGGKSPTIVAKGQRAGPHRVRHRLGKAPERISIVNDQQYSMLIDLIDDARVHGARIIEIGHRSGDATRRPHTLAPTVVLGVTDEMKIAHEEIFGPTLPIFGYGNVDDAIDYVNARLRPLALYYFGDDDADRRKVLDRTPSGNVTINGTIMHVAQPFASRADTLLKFFLR